MCSPRVRNSLTESSPSPFLSAAASSSSTDSLVQSSESKAFKTSAKPRWSEMGQVTASHSMSQYEFLSHPCKVVLGCHPPPPVPAPLPTHLWRWIQIRQHRTSEMPRAPSHHIALRPPCRWGLWNPKSCGTIPPSLPLLKALGFSRSGRKCLGPRVWLRAWTCDLHQVVTMETSSSPNVVL